MWRITKRQRRQEPQNRYIHWQAAEVFGRSLVYDKIFDACSPATRYRLSWTCKDARQALQDWTTRNYDINKHFNRFVDNPVDFRSMMAHTGSVVSGSNALQFLDRVYYPESDLDLYVYREFVVEVVNWIIERAGRSYQYTVRDAQSADLQSELISIKAGERFKPIEAEGDEANDGRRIVFEPITQNTYRMNWIAGVLTFTSDQSIDDHLLKIQVIVGSSTPMQGILSFHSTVVMNAITAYGAYSFYPTATFEKRQALAFSQDYGTLGTALSKYAERGYNIMADVFQHERADSNCAFHHGERCITDRWTWILPFPMDGVSLPQFSESSLPLKSDPLLMNSWSFENETMVKPSMHWYLLYGRILRFQYVAVKGFRDFVRQFLSKQGKMNRLPNDFLQEQDLPIDPLKVQWWDSEVPAWREAYGKHLKKSQGQTS